MLWSPVPVHAAADLLSARPGLLVVVVLGGLGAAVVSGLALAAFLRRRSRSYLLVALAIIAVLARTVVAGLSLNGSLAPATHHLTEHVLDVVMVALVVAAVYTARGVRGGEPA
jgi:hypothetical protein